MSRQMKAERDKRAAILEAEARNRRPLPWPRAATVGDSGSRGRAEAVRKTADAEKYRQIAVAEGQAKAIADVFGAIHEGKPDEELITLKYLEMLPELAKAAPTRSFCPMKPAELLPPCRPWSRRQKRRTG
jgi:regulator of protease activity HflC (stomatin/prohibitin superfamily)